MLNKTSIRSFLLPGLLGAAAAAVLIVGCQTAPVGPSAGAATRPAGAAAAPPKSGAQLWAETCNHCHNIRSPSNFNAAEWDVIVMHMRDRADLPGDQARAIAEFLKAASH